MKRKFDRQLSGMPRPIGYTMALGEDTFGIAECVVTAPDKESLIGLMRHLVPEIVIDEQRIYRTETRHLV
jgi:hypothetical protein